MPVVYLGIQCQQSIQVYTALGQVSHVLYGKSAINKAQTVNRPIKHQGSGGV